MSDDIKPVFHGELQLAGWSETHNGGCKITFWLPDASDLDVFRALTVRKGNQAGQRFACVLVEINEQEQPVPPPEPVKAPEPEAPKGGALARLAGMWCADLEFWEFLEYRHGRYMNGASVGSAADAKFIVCKVCRIQSRAELDHDDMAAALFHGEIREPFMRWKQGVR